MKIIISPAKKMNIARDSFEVKGKPAFMEKTKVLKEQIRDLSWGEAKELWQCNDKLTDLNYKRFKDMDLERCLTPAVFSYEGIQYQYMSPGVMEIRQLEYIGEHLRILSGFYGVLKPFDGVVPYRLEMQTKMQVGGAKNLYEFWGAEIYEELVKDDHVILNLASKEYSKVVEGYLTEEDRYITCIFAQEKNGKLVQKATMAKMARGEMVNYLAAAKAGNPEDAKKFDRLNYRFRPELSCEDEYVFTV